MHNGLLTEAEGLLTKLQATGESRLICWIWINHVYETVDIVNPVFKVVVFWFWFVARLRSSP